MSLHLSRDNYQIYRAYRALLDDKLTELMLYAKELCPDAVVEVGALRTRTKTGMWISSPLLDFQRKKKNGLSWPLRPVPERFLKKPACLFSALPSTPRPNNDGCAPCTNQSGAL